MTRKAYYVSEMRLNDRAGQRLYINAEDRSRFLLATSSLAPRQRSFCLTLLYTGCRISEALELRTSSFQMAAGIVTLRTLKRRRPDEFRDVPVPRHLIEVIKTAHRMEDGQFWPGINRTTAYRWVKGAMAAAGISGVHASPKGLRHGFGIHAIQCGVQLNMLQKWMGHASMTTTAIYANAIGDEERAIAARMWAEESARFKGVDLK